MSPAPSRKNEIMVHAACCAARVGLEGLSIGKLAKDLSISKSGILSHFESKEGLQLSVLNLVAERFKRVAVAPSLKAPRGEPRLRSFFENWLGWVSNNPFGWGCLLSAASTELDDLEGASRDMVASHQQELGEFVAQLARVGMSEGHLRPDFDPEQVAYELKGVILAFQHAHRLLHDPKAHLRARAAFERVLASITNARTPA